MWLGGLFFPYRYKRLGLALLLAGIAGLIFYVWFEFRLTMPVFAVFSSFIETKTFTAFETNVADELIMLSLLAGFFFLVFSKEKTESEKLDLLRAIAFRRAMLANMALLFFSILFVFGNGFMAIILLNLYAVFIFYLAFYYYLKMKL